MYKELNPGSTEAAELYQTLYDTSAKVNLLLTAEALQESGLSANGAN
jgi:hypothetical protein